MGCVKGDHPAADGWRERITDNLAICTCQAGVLDWSGLVYFQRIIMTEIGAYEAKTHLPKLLSRVQDGESFTITRHGQPVAELVPLARRDKEAIRKTIAETRAYREELARQGISWKNILEPGETLRELAHHGHRY